LRAQMPTDGVKKTLNIAYGPADAQKLDVYEPATPVTKAPVLIFIHGGAFVGGSKSDYDPSLDPITPGDPPNAADAAKIPTLIFYSLLCHRDNQCPLMYRFLMHDHISAPSAINTGDETVSTPLLNFIRAR
jgi:hypothetical protein